QVVSIAGSRSFLARIKDLVGDFWGMAIEKIIILGNDSGFRTHLEDYLRRNRYDVAPAATVAAARNYLNRDNFDLIFLDLHLDEGVSINFLKEIQTRPQKPLTVVTAASGDAELAVD